MCEKKEEDKKEEEVPVEEESFEGRQLGRKGMKERREEGMGSSAVVKCQFCGLEMRARQLPSHLARCPQATIKCKHPSCNNFTSRGLLGEHEDSCTHRIVECRGCGNDVEFGELGEHEKECSGGEVGVMPVMPVMPVMLTQTKLVKGGGLGVGSQGEGEGVCVCAYKGCRYMGNTHQLLAHWEHSIYIYIYIYI